MDFMPVEVGERKDFIKTIEWDMMDKTKFFPLSMLSSFSVRCALYPLTLIKTRLQVQKHNDMYTGKRVIIFYSFYFFAVLVIWKR